MADRIRVHGITLVDDDLVLRPMTEDDADVLFRWNNDPEVLHFMEGATGDDPALGAQLASCQP